MKSFSSACFRGDKRPCGLRRRRAPAFSAARTAGSEWPASGDEQRSVLVSGGGGADSAHGQGRFPQHSPPRRHPSCLWTVPQRTPANQRHHQRFFPFWTLLQYYHSTLVEKKRTQKLPKKKNIFFLCVLGAMQFSQAYNFSSFFFSQLGFIGDLDLLF